MKKILTIFSIIVISLFILSIYGWFVYHITLGDKNFGFLNSTIKFMYSFPDMFKQSVKEVQTLPETFVKTPEEFKPINELDSDLIVLISYSDINDTRTIAMINLRNDSILYKWNLKNPYEKNDRVVHPLLLPNKNLIFSFMDKNLFRIDSLSNIVWRQKNLFSHHSLNFDSDGNVWVCSRKPFYYASGLYTLGGREIYYIDNSISKIDVETGEILFEKSVSEILKENNLQNYLLKAPEVKDPIHLNDVQPALKTTAYYNEGDLFLSFRQMSIILQYRPSTNKVIRVIEGPFCAQHDVDIYDDKSIVFFNNNSHILWSDGMNAPNNSNKPNLFENFFSEIIKYNFHDNTFDVIGDSIFRVNRIYTHTEGLIKFLGRNTYFVEQQNQGIVWVIKDNKVIYKNVFKSQHNGYHHLTNWTRIIRYGK